MNHEIGRCDWTQYEHCGLHEQIGEYGQRLPPFACKNWRRDEAAEAERQRACEAKCQRAIQVALILYTGNAPEMTTDNGVTTFEMDGHRYEIREID